MRVGALAQVLSLGIALETRGPQRATRGQARWSTEGAGPLVASGGALARPHQLLFTRAAAARWRGGTI